MSVTINGTSGLVFNDASTQNTAATGFGFKNRIINGAMMIDQRNAGASVTPTTTVYTIDRFQNFVLGSATGRYSVQRSTVSPAGFTNSMLLTVTTTDASPSAAFGYGVAQSIEGFNIADLGWGTSNAQPITISFLVRSSVTGSYCLNLANNTGSLQYTTTYTINSANTWEQKTVTIAGPTSGTWESTNSSGLLVVFGLGGGSNRITSSLNSWDVVGGTTRTAVTGATNLLATNGATFYITGVQLEKGSTATSFDYRPYGTELALCQRYCINYRSADSASAYYTYGYGNNLATTRLDCGVNFPVQMRVTPTLTTTGTASNYAIYEAVGVVGCSAIPSIGAGNQLNVQIIATTAGSLTAGRGGSLISNNNNTSYLLFTAEL